MTISRTRCVIEPVRKDIVFFRKIDVVDNGSDFWLRQLIDLEVPEFHGPILIEVLNEPSGLPVVSSARFAFGDFLHVGDCVGGDVPSSVQDCYKPLCVRYLVSVPSCTRESVSQSGKWTSLVLKGRDEFCGTSRIYHTPY